MGLSQSFSVISVYRRELVGTNTAQRAFKIFGKFLKRSAGFNALIGSTYGTIILPSANVTYIFLHIIHICIF